MDAAATLVWIAPAPPDADQAKALETWARAHGVTFTQPTEGHAPALPVDATVAETVEAGLDRAREALAARDMAAFEGALSAAEAALRGQPQLPQGLWLMAEILRTRARAPSAGAGAGAGENAWLEAAALDGGRVAGLGESAKGAPLARATLSLEGVPSGREVRLDGKAVGPGPVETTAGPHLASVVAAGASGGVVWARWLDVAAGTTTVRVEAPAAPACSRDEVERVRLDGGGVSPGDVQCGAWVAAAPGEGAVRVAVCAGPRCGALASWAPPPPVAFTPPPLVVVAHKGWPAWATWGLVGLGVVTAGTIGVIASGALASPGQETRFVSGGIKTQ